MGDKKSTNWAGSKAIGTMVGRGSQRLETRSLKARILERESLPVLRVEEKVIHGQLVKVKVLPPAGAQGCNWWAKESKIRLDKVVMVDGD